MLKYKRKNDNAHSTSYREDTTWKYLIHISLYIHRLLLPLCAPPMTVFRLRPAGIGNDLLKP